jgi:hypothetical protein
MKKSKKQKVYIGCTTLDKGMVVSVMTPDEIQKNGDYTVTKYKVAGWFVLNT